MFGVSLATTFLVINRLPTVGAASPVHALLASPVALLALVGGAAAVRWLDGRPDPAARDDRTDGMERL